MFIREKIFHYKYSKLSSSTFTMGQNLLITGAAGYM